MHNLWIAHRPHNLATRYGARPKVSTAREDMQPPTLSPKASQTPPLQRRTHAYTRLCAAEAAEA